MIVAAADGSSLANPGPTGWAWYIDDAHWAAGGWARGTNNMGELMSVLDLLRATRGTDEPLRVICDSQYAINCCTRWIPAWKKRGWRKADNKPVLNLDLLQQLDEELAGRRVTFQWVKGHAGHHLNERADDLARAAATAYQQGTPVASGPGFTKAPLADAPETAPESAELGPEVAVERGTEELLPLPLDSPAPGGMLPIPDPPAPRTSAPEGWQPPLSPDLPATRRPRRPARGEADTALVVDITEWTRELLSDDTQLDRERLDELMHPDFVAHLPGGVIRTKGSILARPATLTGPVQLDVLGADILGSDLVLLRYKLKRNSEDHLCATLWQRGPAGWRARFQQITPA